MTKIHKWIYTICVFLLVSFFGAVALGQYSDYINCLCSIATTEHQTRTIDDLLRAYYEPNLDSGTFTLTSFECRHHKHIWVMVYPAQNEYEFWTASK